LSGISRQNANKRLRRLQKAGLLRLEYGGLATIDVDSCTATVSNQERLKSVATGLIFHGLLR
jgi:hypothetical protein